MVKIWSGEQKQEKKTNEEEATRQPTCKVIQKKISFGRAIINQKNDNKIRTKFVENDGWGRSSATISKLAGEAVEESNQNKNQIKQFG